MYMCILFLISPLSLSLFLSLSHTHTHTRTHTHRPGPGWAHMSCALWIPEVKIGSTEKMEPITNIEAIPVSLVTCVHVYFF